MPTQAYSCLVKLIITGNSATGKSCILRMFADGKFKEDTMHTVGVEFNNKYLTIDDETIKLQIWDTAGQEQFESVTRSYYRGSSGALVVYDVTNRDSYNSVMKWITNVRELALQNVAVILIGNKVDLADEAREVSYEEARQFASENGITHFLETSAKSGVNINDAFTQLARSAVGCLSERQVPSDYDLTRLGRPKCETSPSDQNSSSSCC